MSWRLWIRSQRIFLRPFLITLKILFYLWGVENWEYYIVNKVLKLYLTSNSMFVLIWILLGNWFESNTSFNKGKLYLEKSRLFKNIWEGLYLKIGMFFERFGDFWGIDFLNRFLRLESWKFLQEIFFIISFSLLWKRINWIVRPCKSEKISFFGISRVDVRGMTLYLNRESSRIFHKILLFIWLE